jgi:uncharacterized membrane protein YoaK (UPF0700 family)
MDAITFFEKIIPNSKWDNKWAHYSAIVAGLGILITGATNINFGMFWGFISSVAIFGMLLGAIQSKLLSKYFEKANIWIFATLLAFLVSALINILFDSSSTSVETGPFQW